MIIKTTLYIKILSSPMGGLISGIIENKLCYLLFIDGEKSIDKLLQVSKSLRAEIVYCGLDNDTVVCKEGLLTKLQEEIDAYNTCANNVTVNSDAFFDNPYARNRKPVNSDQPLFEEVQRQLNQYFAKEISTFTIPLTFVGSPFQKHVWESLVQIPYGESCSYHEQAASIGRLSATRAVANANAQNFIIIIVPCHRVISSDGSIGGYSAGIWRKKELLELEGVLKIDQKLPGFF